MKNFDYGYAPTLYKNDIILKDILVKPVKQRGDLSLPIPIYGGGGAKSKKSFDYGYAPTLYKNDIILNDYIPEVKPVRGMFVDDLSQPIDYNPIYVPPPYIDYPPTEPPQTINPKFYYSIFIDDMPPPVEQPIEMPVEQPQMPIEQPIEMPIQTPKSQIYVIDDMTSPIQPIKLPEISPSFNDALTDVMQTTSIQKPLPSTAGGFVNDSDKSKVLPLKEVSKNLKPYIYAGLGIVVILIVSRMLTKKD
jgi:hypothetical protein